MDDFCLERGRLPLLLSLPHDGVMLPGDIIRRLTPEARAVPDTDWHVGRLYAFARQLGASVLRPTWSRYVVDLNRPPDDVSLYPGRATTGLCPARRFTGDPLYLPGEEPCAEEIAERVTRYWQPYHSALREELDRLRDLHGYVLLWEGHSIRSEVPWLFEGRLPDLNLGTAEGSSCSQPVEQRIQAVCAGQEAYTWVLNGRFKGGYITRHYGDPEGGIDAVQLELAQCTYMDEDSTAFDAARAARLQPVLSALIEAALGRRPRMARRLAAKAG
ncbi:N-formylglutamate deformylase [Pseudomarimonas salicorniae]|uniref:N-formylglutamate deformylase n=1 Tax=Pseudomarimonas salicorniae TaxID=2933270 RepID=A0ABT0GKW4_9GAMM|nr:N-formylglutamate deformylase [Lysobacter sp. CAU 1642]MCK7595177.1 N-formylglutamate deformylase [Lysobacter sp. CAU 1642]